MLPIFSFILMWFGSLNWFFISAFQYDFVAGFFGTQSSLFSRIIYFAIGLAGFFLLFHMLKNKGKFNLFENPFKHKFRGQSDAQHAKIAAPVTVVPPAENSMAGGPGEDDFSANIPQRFETSSTPSAPTQSKTHFAEPVAEKGYKDFDVSKYDN